MSDVRWHEYDHLDDLVTSLAAAAITVISSALAAKGAACISLPGGNTPLPAFQRMRLASIDWGSVTIIPGDDRLVGDDDKLCNSTMLMRHFGPLGAHVLRMNVASGDPYAAAEIADARLADTPWPPDLVLLGMGADGHTASILPGPDMEGALTMALPRRVVGVKPDPLPPEAPVSRVTLTRSALLSGACMMIMLSGDVKRNILQKAMAQGALSPFPIGRVLAEARSPIDIYWSPA